MSDDITFQEFQELCQEAGISTDNLETLEQDYRAGRALADVTDALITSQEEHPARYTRQESIGYMEAALELLRQNQPLEVKKAALGLAVGALRYLAECCHDEGDN